MKKILFIHIAALITILQGCDSNNRCENVERDLITPDICIVVTNAVGENLLDPDVEGNILDSDITVEYNGETYALTDKNTRASKPVWHGLRIEKFDYGDDRPTLKFGEFDTSVGQRGETFTVNWGDGTSNDVAFDLYATWKKCNPTVHQKIWLDGVLKSNDSLVIEMTK